MPIILTKKSDTASAVPLAADLTNNAGGAELAVNATDKRLYSKTSGGSVVELGTNPSSLTMPNGTANGLAFLNASKVVTSGSALTFDGQTQAINVTASGGLRELLRLANAGSGDGTTAQMTFYAAGTNYAQITGGYSGAPALISNVYSGGYQAWQINGSEQMRLTSTGLGIGTSSPAAKLHIKGSSNPAIYWENSSFGSATNAAFMGSAGQLIFGRTGVADWLTIDTSGNLGLGVTPSAWSTGKAYELVSAGNAMWALSNENNITQNAVFNAGWKYGSTGASTRYQQQTGSHIWWNAASGTAGNAITFTQAMSLTAAGKLLLGTTDAPSTHMMKVTSSTDAGILLTGANSVANDGSFTVQVANGTILMVSENNTGDGALFFCGYASATITLLSDPNNRYATSITAGRICVTKSAASSTVTITNKIGSSRSITVGKLSASD